MKQSTTIDIKNKWAKLEDDERYLRCENADKILGS